MLLQDKHVLVFAASGAIAGEAARTFAAEGAVVHLSARSADAIHALADTIRANGGSATAHIVDATDERAVEAYVAQIAAEHGRIDGVFNGIGGRPSELGYPERLSALHIDQFMKPLNIVLGSTFITSRAVGLVMASQGSGAIVTLSATLSSMTAPYMSNITATCSAIEGLTRALAGDFGPAGVRVNCVRGNAMPETRTIQETGAGQMALGGGMGDMRLPPLGRPITVSETAALAAYLLSDRASGMTGQVVTVSAGAFV